MCYTHEFKIFLKSQLPDTCCHLGEVNQSYRTMYFIPLPTWRVTKFIKAMYKYLDIVTARNCRPLALFNFN